MNHDGIRRVVEAVERIPVFGNGDVRSIADAARMIDETGCPGIAIGRGALANPWVFRRLSNWVNTGDPGPRASYAERFAFMRLHVRRLVAWKGNEKYGCIQFRKIATWYTRRVQAAQARTATPGHAGEPRPVRGNRGAVRGCRPACRMERLGHAASTGRRPGGADQPLVKLRRKGEGVKG